MSVVITGFGVVTSIGVGRDAFAAALQRGDCGVGPIRSFDASDYKSAVAAEIRQPVATPALRVRARAVGVRLPTRHGRAALFAAAALVEALEQAGLHTSDLGDLGTGMAFGGSTAGMPEAEGALLAGGEDYWQRAEARRFLGTPVGTTADVVAHAAGIGGPLTTISTACSSATNALGQALDWLRSGACDRVIAGGSDGFCRLTHAGFNSLSLVDPHRPRPFDARREGMVIGEGGALFVLEREDRARARGAVIQGRLLGFGNVAEAHHLVQPQPDGLGSEAAMNAALNDAGLAPERIDYVNAHGTATPQNDLAEARGVRRVFGARDLPVSSTKSQVGHLLGASGAVELAALLLAMQGGFVPPTAGWAEADPEIDLDVVPTCRRGRVGAALSNSFAFGGNDSTLCVGHADLERP